MAGGDGGKSLKETPTWAVAVVCTVMILVSVIIEHIIEHLYKVFQKRQKKAMLEALEKIKSELMLLGFISLFLTATQQPVSKICISESLGRTMLPCMDHDDSEDNSTDIGSHRRLLGSSLGGYDPWRRKLAGGGKNEDYCQEFGKVPLISQSGIHQLHIFIFVLAVFHVLYSVLTISLAHAKMKKWKAWEAETASIEYQFSNDPSRFRLTHQTSFVRRHSKASGIPAVGWIVAFFRQFIGSVTKVDYMTLRHGFINAHLAPNSKFNFHKYIKRSLEDDFKRVVGISLPLWFLAIAMLLLNVYGWYTLYLISFLPIVIILVVGTKLELVIRKMALQIQEKTSVVLGAPIVQPSNELFWFGHPEWILKLIHLTLFENAFQVSHFLWTWYSFGLKSCFNAELPVSIIRISMGIALQILCSYITFPLYALVTQMGSSYKKGIFEHQIAEGLLKWRQAAKDRKRLREMGLDFSSRVGSREGTVSGSASPIPLLPNNRAMQDAEMSVTTSPARSLSENNLEQLESQSYRPRSNSMTRRPV